MSLPGAPTGLVMQRRNTLLEETIVEETSSVRTLASSTRGSFESRRAGNSGWVAVQDGCRDDNGEVKEMPARLKGTTFGGHSVQTQPRLMQPLSPGQAPSGALQDVIGRKTSITGSLQAVRERLGEEENVGEEEERNDDDGEASPLAPRTHELRAMGPDEQPAIGPGGRRRGQYTIGGSFVDGDGNIVYVPRESVANGAASRVYGPEVNEAMPAAYWAGRFSAVHDRLYEAMCDGVPSVDAPSAERAGDVALARVKRSFAMLLSRCKTREAIESLRAFQHAYARINHMPSVVPSQIRLAPLMRRLENATSSSSSAPQQPQAQRPLPQPAQGMSATQQFQLQTDPFHGIGTGADGSGAPTGGAAPPGAAGQGQRSKTSFMDRLRARAGRKAS
ncbi:hypothetical protein BDY21DRAFT_371485 [Lineolata rhizophorae]|uniref:Uncharacterized protein n=1 Tax=Lineolata rhizophorae TaxID=578093 RepID=A0A6A6P1T7_9PEZI|nr:hypothetical protein BDY21DRAFT_371485 [Lineolata rhizophorae]